MISYLRLLISGLVVSCGLMLGSLGWGAADASPQLFETADRCMACHNGLTTPTGENVSMGIDWRPSMMANSSRDPYWQAAVRREVQDHPSAGTDIENECAICHMPMARTEAKAGKNEFGVFAHLPARPGAQRADLLAADGVSCSMCHRVEAENLGKPESFTGGFVVSPQTAISQRAVFGPYDVDKGRTRIMQSSSGFMPAKSAHIASSELCATCHTLITHALDSSGQVAGTLPEQVPYLEWRHSMYSDALSCQSCHMPTAGGQMPISSVLGQPRENLARHVFRAGNFLMPRIFSRYQDELRVTALPLELNAASQRAMEHLETSAAGITISNARISSGTLLAEIEIRNDAGHKLPTAYPSRRVWVHIVVRDSQANKVFESGALRTDGSIVGNDNDQDAGRYEPHYDQIDDVEKVQIYEAIMADNAGKVTTGLLTATRFIKDNRLLPQGFDKSTASADVAVHGFALEDETFGEGKDRIRYAVKLAGPLDSYTIQVELYFQPIAFRWAQNLSDRKSAETDRFVSYFESMANASTVVLARASAKVP